MRGHQQGLKKKKNRSTEQKIGKEWKEGRRYRICRRRRMGLKNGGKMKKRGSMEAGEKKRENVLVLLIGSITTEGYCNHHWGITCHRM